MDLQKNARVAWIAAIIMGLIALVLLVILLTMSGSRGGLNDVRAQIRKDCTAGDTQSQNRCARTLAQLQGILMDIGEDIEEPAATTTPAQ